MVTTVANTLSAFLIPFARHFRAQGWAVDAMAHGASSRPELLQAYGRVFEASWSRSALDPRNLISAPQQVRTAIATGNYDLVHVHTPVAAFTTRFALRAGGRPRPKIVYTAHGFHFHQGGGAVKNTLFLGIEKLAAPWTDALVVINDEDDEAAHSYSLLPPERIYRMPGIGVDTEIYNPEMVPSADCKGVRDELGLSETDHLFVMVAEFNRGKRHRDAVHALALLGRHNVHLAFAGAGPLVEETRALTAKLDMDRQVHFLGRRDDVPALMCTALATVLPSEREGLSRSLMESLALGVPGIGANVRGIRDLLNGGCGILVPVGNHIELARAMGWIIDNPGARVEMGQRGRERMAAFDLRRVIALHEKLYAELLDELPSRGSAIP
jgi:glycosyltransferase involved in cell wall biosynthesis